MILTIVSLANDHWGCSKLMIPWCSDCVAAIMQHLCYDSNKIWLNLLHLFIDSIIVQSCNTTYNVMQRFRKCFRGWSRMPHFLVMTLKAISIPILKFDEKRWNCHFLCANQDLHQNWNKVWTVSNPDIYILNFVIQSTLFDTIAIYTPGLPSPRNVKRQLALQLAWIVMQLEWP